MSKKILITGGAGFIGSHICDAIFKLTDWDIVIIDRLDYASNGLDRLRDSELFNAARTRIFTWDLRTPFSENMIKEIGHIDYIIHMAASTHVDDSIVNPVEFIKNNIDSTLNMLEYARKVKPERMFYFSTDEFYGPAPESVDYKEGDRANPTNPYSSSKAASEDICRAYANTYKVPITITNLMNVIGERQHVQKFLPKTINAILDGKVLEIHSDGKQAGKRYYIHARNVADAIIFIIKNTNETLDPVDAGKGKFNIVGEKEMDNLQFAKLIEKAVNKVTGKNYVLKYKLVQFPADRPGHDMRYALSGEKLRKLGWIPPKTVEESIERVVEWSLKDENLKWLGRKSIVS
jgi:dTDP-glucose 4,6-dehydratase